MLGGAGEATNFGFILLMEAVLGFFSGSSARENKHGKHEVCRALGTLFFFEINWALA